MGARVRVRLQLYRHHGVGARARVRPPRWREDAWEEQETAGLGQPLNGVWTAPGETVWVAGMSGSQAYLEDGAWKIPDFPLTGEHYHAVWKHGDEALFLGGNLLSTAPPYHGIIGRHGPARGGLEVSECQ